MLTNMDDPEAAEEALWALNVLEARGGKPYEL